MASVLPSRLLTSLSLLLSAVLAAAQQSAPSGKVQLLPRSPAQREQLTTARRHLSLDVAVADPTGNPVPGRSARDFVLLDNDKPLPVVSFTASSADAPPQLILVLDALNNSFDNIADERKGLAAYLAGNPSGRLDRTHPQLPWSTSIILLSDHGARVGKPTRDRQLLLEDLKRLPTPIPMIGPAEGFNGALRRFQLSVRMLTDLTTYETTQPGRKIVVWIGSGWPLLSNSHSQFTARDRSGYFSAIVQLTNQLREARITLDAVETPALSRGTEQTRDYYKLFLKPVPAAAQADSGYLALPVLALNSGGLALRYSNSIAGSIAQCATDLDTYYTLSFDTAPAAHPDEYHALHLTTAHPDTTLRTTRAYYAQP